MKEKITIGEMKKDVQFYHHEDESFPNGVYTPPRTENSYKKFIKEYKEINKELSNQLKNDNGDIKELLETLDKVVVKILDYRYDIIENLNYCENDDYYLSHKYLNT